MNDPGLGDSQPYTGTRRLDRGLSIMRRPNATCIPCHTESIVLPICVSIGEP